MPLSLQDTKELDFAGLLMLLYEHRFTGAIVLNFRGGIPKVAEVPSVQIRLETGSALDKGLAVSAL